MKNIIRLTESDLHRIIESAVLQALHEEDAPGGAFNSGASTGGNLNVGTSDTAGGATFGAGMVQKKSIYSPRKKKASKQSSGDEFWGECNSRKPGFSVKGKA